MNIFSEFIRRLFYLPPAYPQTIQIGITNICNFKCLICQRFDLKVDLRHMDFEVYKKIINKIDAQKCPNLILTGWGEPLCHPEFLNMIKLASDKGFNVRFTTNGSLLDKDKIKFLLNQEIEAITFSIDELETNNESIGHLISNQLGNIKNFIKFKNESNKKTKVFLQTTYQQGGESNILKIIDWADQIKVDRVKISRLDIRFQKFDRPSAKQEKDFIKKIESYTRAMHVKVDFLPYLAFDGWVRQIYKLIYIWLHQHGRFCLRIFSDLYINVNGQATPCCALPKYEIGDTLNSEINEIWHGLPLKRFRKKQKLICGACDVLEIDYKG